MVKRKMKCWAYPIMTVIILIAILAMLTLYIFTLVYKPVREAWMEKYIITFILWTMVSCGLSVVILCLIAKPLLSVVRIDETGVSRAFLSRFWKLHISWEEMVEARYFISITGQIIFSKTKSLNYIPLSKWHKIKDIIFLGLSKKRYRVIKQYLQQPILCMPEEVKARFERRKNNNKNESEEQ